MRFLRGLPTIESWKSRTKVLKQLQHMLDLTGRRLLRKWLESSLNQTRNGSAGLLLTRVDCGQLGSAQIWSDLSRVDCRSGTAIRSSQ